MVVRLTAELQACSNSMIIAWHTTVAELGQSLFPMIPVERTQLFRDLKVTSLLYKIDGKYAHDDSLRFSLLHETSAIVRLTALWDELPILFGIKFPPAVSHIDYHSWRLPVFVVDRVSYSSIAYIAYAGDASGFFKHTPGSQESLHPKFHRNNAILLSITPVDRTYTKRRNLWYSTCTIIFFNRIEYDILRRLSQPLTTCGAIRQTS